VGLIGNMSVKIYGITAGTHIQKNIRKVKHLDILFFSNGGNISCLRLSGTWDSMVGLSRNLFNHLLNFKLFFRVSFFGSLLWISIILNLKFFICHKSFHLILSLNLSLFWTLILICLYAPHLLSLRIWTSLSYIITTIVVRLMEWYFGPISILSFVLK